MGVFIIWTYGRVRDSTERAHSLHSCAPIHPTRSRFALKDAVRSLVLLVGALDLVVILLVHGSGAFGVKNLTILQRSNGLSRPGSHT